MNGIKVNLTRNGGYPWVTKGAVSFKGYGFLDGKLYHDTDLTELLQTKTQTEVLNICKRLDGLFSIIIRYEDHVFVAVDHLRTFPLFLYQKGETTLVLDSLDGQRLQNMTFSENSLKQFDGCLYLLGEQTLFKNVRGLQAGHYWNIYSNGKTDSNQYWEFHYQKEQINNLEQALQRLTKAYEESFQNLIQFLGGRKAVIPLSGGHDSRMVAYYLKKYGYDNILAFSYGRPSMEDSVLSRQVAETLHIPYRYIPYTRKAFHAAREEFNRYLLYAGNGVSVPRVQTWYGFRQLVKEGLVDKDCVVCPGYGGVLPGHYVSEMYIQNGTVNKKRHLLKIQNEFFPHLHRRDPEYYQIFLQQFLAASKLDEMPDEIDAKKAAEFFEQLIFLEDQTKGIQNAARIYEFYGVPWYTPFLDKQQFQTWSEVDNCLRYANKAFLAMEQQLYEGPIKKVVFTGSKEMGYEKEPASKTPTVVSRINRLGKAALHPAKQHYMNVAVPLKSYYYNLFWERNAENFHSIQKMYLSLLKKHMGLK